MKWWTGLTALVLLVILIVGLKPKDISPPNHAEWLPDRTGLHFEKLGIAFTDSISDLIQTDASPREEFSIEIALKTKDFSEHGFHFILLLHDGQDSDQLLIGQWSSALIVMNGDDYAYRRKTDRLTVKSTVEFPKTQFVTVTTGREGTRVYIDGRLAAEKKEMHLEMPEGKNLRLIVGNSGYGNHPWEGDLYGVAVFEKELTEGEVATHYNGWSEKLDFTFAQSLAPAVLYNLDQKGTNQAAPDAGSAHSLRVPPRMKLLIPSFFFQKWGFQRNGSSLFRDRDAALNFLGFIPLGLLLGATLIRMGGKSETHCVKITLAAGFLVSLCIETLQAWMPTRSSDMQDLILNTAGTLVGALCCRYLIFRGGGTKAQRHRGTEGPTARS